MNKFGKFFSLVGFKKTKNHRRTKYKKQKRRRTRRYMRGAMKGVMKGVMKGG
jgi:hypothetical protein